MGSKRLKTKAAADVTGTSSYFLTTGGKSGLLSGTFFRIGTRGDYLWDIDLLEERLKKLAQGEVPQVDNIVEYGKLRKVQI